ncbi:DUF1190 domain-containing protein [Geobacter sp. FeAm09]|uniref:DUF1190 domain-containing protein n=1 Tax=Geobacter sp. FeAm09 TaxID=2597769 RepID=UPI0011ED275A|nr:DUF1190 domain-containing protein [Geobacter sp. FeAm09]QEM69936.1 DUF1190 domain-containing protein [Geobacter sp. FeAm09]
MGLFEKIELEPIEPEEPGDAPQPSRPRPGATLTVAYQPGKKAVLLLYPLFAGLVLQSLLSSGFFAFEALAAAAVAIGVWYLGDCLMTRDFTFSPDRVVKRGFIGQTVLPADGLVMTVTEQTIRLSRGTDRNIREAVTIRRYFITPDESAGIQAYAKGAYHVGANRKKAGNAGGNQGPSGLALVEYQRSVSTYRTTAVFFAVYALIAIFTAGLSERFFGLAPALSADLARLACIGLAIAGFLLLRRLATPIAQGGPAQGTPVTVRLQRADRRAFLSALTANGMAGLGVLLFLLFGNMLDFYLFIIVGILSFFDYYPRLSTWERIVRGEGAAAPAPGEVAVSPRRSLQVSLVLMGTLSVLSYGETNRYLYANRQDCREDWGDKDCQEAPAGSGHYAGGRYYGPRYGSAGGRATRSVGVGTISRGGFGSLGSFHASFGG